MDYNISELSRIAGVSARTLRYYDEIGLLKPLYTNDAGCRFYGEKEVEVLQQILFYRERGFELKRIQHIIYQDDFDIMCALNEHLQALEDQQAHMEAVILTVRQTIASMKGAYEMSDKEKFQPFKEQLVQDNEEKYGEEIRGKYGDKTVEESNRKMLNMSQEEWEYFQRLGTEINVRLQEGVNKGIKADSQEAKEIAKLHKEWLMKTWKQYSPEAHMNLTEMYVADDRFRQYYDAEVDGCAELLKEAVCRWVTE